MQQISPQSQSSQNLTQGRALWFVSILLVLLVGTAIGATWLFLHTARENIPITLKHDLETPIQRRVAMLTGWHAKLQDQVTRLVGMDVIRLFANEINNLDDNNITAMLAREREEHTSPGDQDDVSRLASQMPLLRHSLQNLIAQSDIVATTLVTSSMYPYLSSEEAAPALPPNVQQAVQSSLRDAKAVIMPIQRTPDKELHTKIIQPLFAPEYIERPGNNAVGAMIITCDVMRLISDMTVDMDNQKGWIFQIGESGLQRILPDGTISEPFTEWEMDASGNLPVQLRTLPDVGDVYVLGMRPPELPLQIVQSIRAESVEATYETYRFQVMFTAVACTLIAMLLIGMFWWWLIGKRERTVSSTLKQLYEAVNQQHALLDSINASLADGIILNNKHGVIGYVNKAFASMIGMKPEDLIGRAITAVLSKQLADSFFLRMGQAIKNNKSELYDEILNLKNEHRHYQVSCSPFRNTEGDISGIVSMYSDVTDMVHAQEQTQIVLNQAIDALVHAIEAIDPYLGGQSMQTGILASYLAQGLNLDETHNKTLRLAANLSHLGMIQVPRHLVNKAGVLSEEERAELQKHVDYTRATLKGINFGLPVMEAIYEMHELLDGSGYPRHLRGDEIGINGRILSVANTFCALVCPRSYRQAHGVESALEILSGVPPKYDPKIVSVLREFLQNSDGLTFLSSLTASAKE